MPTTGVCRHIVTPALCAAGESCNPITGCEAGRACATDIDCADMDACTTDKRCDPAARVCTYRPLDGDGDGDPPRVCGGTDCDDSRADVFGGATEICDGIDNDCDGAIDDGASASCEALEVCTAGTCECAPGATTCGGRCTDLTSDSLNCGACYSSCDAGTCAASTCACTGGFMSCDSAAGGSYCTDIVTSVSDCGGCGVRCALNQECADGTCRCLTTGTTVCGGACVDTAVDSTNCGVCGRSCTFDVRGVHETCTAGACVRCGDVGDPCCDLSTTGYDCLPDWSSCGTDHVCAPCGHAGEPCCEFSNCASWDLACGSDGECGCADPLLDPCGAACVSLQSDTANCGACGRTCATGGSCGAGLCTCPGAVGRDCGGVCTDVARDPSNCGACGAGCAPTQACLASTCRDVTAATVTSDQLTGVEMDDTWPSVRLGTDGFVDTYAPYEVSAFHDLYWRVHRVRRLIARFRAPSLPAGATIVGASLVIRPSAIVDAYNVVALHVTSMTPYAITVGLPPPPTINGADYNLARWGATTGFISASALAPEIDATVALPPDALSRLPSTATYWFAGMRTEADVTGGTPPAIGYGEVAPQVDFDAASDVRLVVSYVP